MGKDSITKRAAKMTARKIGEYALETGRDRVEELGDRFEERVETYRENPEQLQQDIEDIHEESLNIGENGVRRAFDLSEELGDDFARRLGWRDSRELFQVCGPLRPELAAYEGEAPGEVKENGRRVDFHRFEADDLEQYIDMPVPAVTADPVSYMVAVRSEAYMRTQDERSAFVEYTFNNDVEDLDDIDDDTTVEVDFYEVR